MPRLWKCWDHEKEHEEFAKVRLEAALQLAGNDEIKAIKAANPLYISRLKKDSPNFISLQPTPRIAGLAACKETGKIEIVILPGTHKQRRNGPKPKVGAGTKLVELSLTKDMHGNDKYGDICDPETGAVISINVVNAGTMNVDYSISYECKEPLNEFEVAAIKPWDQLINFATIEQVKEWLQKYLPADLWEVVKAGKVFVD